MLQICQIVSRHKVVSFLKIHDKDMYNKENTVKNKDVDITFFLVLQQSVDLQ